jgi:hypothetical protein
MKTREIIGNFIQSIMDLKEAKYFLKPVSKDKQAEYEKVIKHPMDFTQIRTKVAETYSIPKVCVSGMDYVSALESNMSLLRR